jgi:hypothetical protein
MKILGCGIGKIFRVDGRREKERERKSRSYIQFKVEQIDQFSSDVLQKLTHEHTKGPSRLQSAIKRLAGE